LAGKAARYPGAHSFGDDHLSRTLFFGRKMESARLVDQILANRVVVVYGRSGLGKTSLIRAGIAEGLHRDGLLPLIVRVNDPNGGPFKSILNDIEREARDHGAEYVRGSAHSLWHYFKTTEFWSGDRLMIPTLILDQCEELLTLHTPEQRDRFLEQLAAVIRGTPPVAPERLPLDRADESQLPEVSPTAPRVRVVIGIREDYLGFLEDVAERVPDILHNRLRLTPLNRKTARDAIVEPAKVDNPALRVPPFEYAAHTVDGILDFLADRSPTNEPGSRDWIDPFQLQLVCQHAEAVADARARARAGNVILTLADLSGEEGLRHVLTGFYLEELNKFPRGRARSRVRTLCERLLISPYGHRLSLEEREIVEVTGLSPSTLEALVDARLLRTDRRAERTYYELSHDTLVSTILDTRRASQRATGWGLAVLGASFAVISVLIGVLGLFVVGASSVDYQPWQLALFSLLYVALAVVGVIGGRTLIHRGRERIRRYRARSATAHSTMRPAAVAVDNR
jgi:hypothetical protein